MIMYDIYKNYNNASLNEIIQRQLALVATFKEGTMIDGENVGSKTIEDVYQSVIKKSGKGQAPAKDSKLYNE